MQEKVEALKEFLKFVTKTGTRHTTYRENKKTTSENKKTCSENKNRKQKQSNKQISKPWEQKTMFRKQKTR